MARDTIARRVTRRISRASRARSTTQVQHTTGAVTQQSLASVTITGLKIGDVVDVDAWFSAAVSNANTKAAYIYLGATNANGGVLAKSGSLANAIAALNSTRFAVKDATTIVFTANDGSQQAKTVDLTAGVIVSFEMFLASADTAYLDGYSVRVANA